MSHPKAPIYQLKAFLKDTKPGIYEVIRGGFIDGSLKINLPQSHRGLEWERYYRLFRKILRKYPYIHSERNLDGEPIQSFYIFRENSLQITPDHLQNFQNHHRKIGLAIGIPKFAVNDFIGRPKGQPLYQVKIPKLGLIFTMSKTEQNLLLLEQFLATKGLTLKHAQIK